MRKHTISPKDLTSKSAQKGSITLPNLSQSIPTNLVDNFKTCQNVEQNITFLQKK